MKKISLLLVMTLAFSSITSQARLLAANDVVNNDKDLRGLNYYDFYVDYINDYYKNVNYYGQYYDWSEYAHINDFVDLRKWFVSQSITNCFYDWCLKYVDENNDSILSVDELAAVRAIDRNSDPERLLGRNAVDYHFDWFPNLEILELDNPSWRYMIGNKNLELYFFLEEIVVNLGPYSPEFINPRAQYLYDTKPFAHLYLPQTGNLRKVNIKNSEMLFFDFNPPQGTPMPEISIEGNVFGEYDNINVPTDKFELDRYVSNGFDLGKIIEVENATLTYDENGKPILLFDEGKQEAHMKYLISTDQETGRQNICESTIRINPKTGWHMKEQQAIHEGETVALDEEHFPDENFRTWMSINVDSNNDNVLTYDELGTIRRIRVTPPDDYIGPTDYPYNPNSQGVEFLMGTENFKGIEYLHSLNAIALGDFGSYNQDPQQIKYYNFKNLDLRKNVNLFYFYLGKFTEAIDVKLPETNLLEIGWLRFETTPPYNELPDFQPPYGELTSRIVSLDDDQSYSLEEDIQKGLDLDRLSVIKGGYLEGNKVVFEEPIVTLLYIARPPVMGRIITDSHGRTKAYSCQYNFITTRLYNSKKYDVQGVVNDLSGIDNVVTNKEVASVLYYNLQGIASDKPFNGFNIRVTTYTDGTRSTEKMVK